MNIAKIYSDHTRVKRDDELKQETKDELTAKQQDTLAKAAKEQWLGQSVTQEFVKTVTDKQFQLIEHAISLATTYHQHNNHQSIIKCLIEANTLNQLLTP